MRTFGNVIWHFPFFGFISAIFVYLFGLLLTLTIIAAPIGLGLMELGKLLFAPFGKVMIDSGDLNLPKNKAWATYSTIIMLLYLPFGLIFAFCAVIQTGLLFLTIVGIPVAMVVAKSLGTYLNPVGKKCVSSAVAAELERRKAEQIVSSVMEPQSPANKHSTNQLVSKKMILIVVGLMVIVGALGHSLRTHKELISTEASKTIPEKVVAPVIIEKSSAKAIVIHSQDGQPKSLVSEEAKPIATLKEVTVAPVVASPEVKQPKKMSLVKVGKSQKRKTEQDDGSQAVVTSKSISDQTPASNNEQQVAVQPVTPSSEQKNKHHGLRGLIEQATGVDPGTGTSEHQCSTGEKAMHANGC